MTLRSFLVEDNEIIRTNLIGALAELAQVEVVASASGQREASGWLAAHPNDWTLAVVDLFLAEGNGMGVVSACRHRRHEQKVVVLSNYATPEIRRRCLELGADAIFDKSNELDALVDYCNALHTAH